VKIAITGSAGTGKSTLAAALGERLALPVVPEGMREYIERTGVNIHDLGLEGLKALVLALWEERQPLEASTGFIADRCSVDFAAFWLFYRFEHDPRTSDLQATFSTHARRYDRVIMLPHGGITLASDGVRTANTWTQLHFQVLVEGLVDRMIDPAKVLRVPAECRSLESRISWVLPRVLE